MPPENWNAVDQAIESDVGDGSGAGGMIELLSRAGSRLDFGKVG